MIPAPPGTVAYYLHPHGGEDLAVPVVAFAPDSTPECGDDDITPQAMVCSLSGKLVFAWEYDPLGRNTGNTLLRIEVPAPPRWIQCNRAWIRSDTVVAVWRDLDGEVYLDTSTATEAISYQPGPPDEHLAAVGLDEVLELIGGPRA